MEGKHQPRSSRKAGTPRCAAASCFGIVCGADACTFTQLQLSVTIATLCNIAVDDAFIHSTLDWNAAAIFCKRSDYSQPCMLLVLWVQSLLTRWWRQQPHHTRGTQPAAAKVTTSKGAATPRLRRGKQNSRCAATCHGNASSSSLLLSAPYGAAVVPAAAGAVVAAPRGRTLPPPPPAAAAERLRFCAASSALSLRSVARFGCRAD